MRNSRTAATPLSLVGKLPEGYIILCRRNGEEYSFLARSLGISVECPHCGATCCGPALAEEYYLTTDAPKASNGGLRPTGSVAMRPPAASRSAG